MPQRSHQPFRTVVATWPLHPLLFAASVVLFAVAHNPTDVPPRQVWLPLGFVLLGTAVVEAVLLAIFRDRYRAALLTTVLLPLFFSYKAIRQTVLFVAEGYFNGSRFLSHPIVISAVLLFWILIGLGLRPFRRKAAELTPFFNVCALVLVGLNLLTIAWNTAETALDRRRQHQSLAAKQLERPIEAAPDRPGSQRDIYYLILDEYAGFNQLEEVFGYDNSRFADQLRARGFFVAVSSSGLYPKTESSLASTLNLHPIRAGEDPTVSFRNNFTVAELKHRGYSIVHFPINEMMVFDQSDQVFVYDKTNKTTTISDFALFLFERSLLQPWHDQIVESGEIGEFHRLKVQYPLSTLPTVASSTGPKFVFVHLACPHFPFVFDRNGGPVSPENFFNIKDPSLYLEQLEFISGEVITLIDLLQSLPGPQPAIIVQSDHGHRGFAPLNEGFSLDVGDSWTNILNAFYLPGIAVETLDPSIKPIDTMHLLFRSIAFSEDASPTSEPTSNRS